MSNSDIALMAHLMRRAGFTATRDELETYVASGYEARVEELLNPGDPQVMPDDIIRRLHIQLDESAAGAGAKWMYRMITTKNPLEEKITLFWHSLFATAYSKTNNSRSILNQIETFRRYSLGSFRDLLVELSKDPAMIFWLDNNDNHNGKVNENYGRELLELFALGIGSYTEDDVKEAARAFTGWTLGNVDYMAVKANKDSFSPYGRIAWHFEYRPDDHDDGEKTFMGETGRFNGEDIVDIIVRQPAAARFVSTRLFQFFAADEVDDEGEKIIEQMIQSYFDSGYEIRSVLRTLFNSDFFKSGAARFARVKAPVELVIGVIRQAGSYREPDLGIEEVSGFSTFMGQGIMQPPSVEGWHEGEEWIESGALLERVNFVAQELGNTSLPGIKRIIERVGSDNGGTLTPDEFVERCLDVIGPIEVEDATRDVLVSHVARRGDIDLRDESVHDESTKRAGELLSLIGSTREFQMA